MLVNRLDGVAFRLKRFYDFSYLKKYGTAFTAFDETGSGCICIGMQDEHSKFFCKIAGADTVEAVVTPEESVEVLKKAVTIYQDVRHASVPKLLDAYFYGRFYTAVFAWADGACLFDHWNFDRYAKDPSLRPPRDRVLTLPADKKLRCADVLFSFLMTVARAGYVAVDFYDGSILYDFDTDTTTICDLDFFRKAPAVNTRGEGWFGTKRLKAPEEYVLGARIDERTNVFTLGALLFEFFGRFSAADIERRYRENRFVPCPLGGWELNRQTYEAARRAVSPERRGRFESVEQFYAAWNRALRAQEAGWPCI